MGVPPLHRNADKYVEDRLRPANGLLRGPGDTGVGVSLTWGVSLSRNKPLVVYFGIVTPPMLATPRLRCLRAHVRTHLQAVIGLPRIYPRFGEVGGPSWCFCTCTPLRSFWV